MGESTVVIKDDGYDELAGIFGGTEIPIPGDEVTGELTVEGDADDGTAGDVNDTDKSGDGTDGDLDSGDDGASDDTDKTDLGEGDAGSATDGDGDAGSKKDESSDDTYTAGAVADKEASEAQLRAQLREQQRKTALVEAKLETLAKQKAADDLADENETDIKPVEPSVLEQHQATLNTIAETRGELMMDMLELMKINPKFEDVETVCSKNNLNDVIETLAQAHVSKEGGDLVETMMAIEVDIWSNRNPYSFMYGLIKDVHPQYAKPAVDDKAGDAQDTTPKDKKPKAPAKAPLSAVDLSRGGGNKNTGEWTAEKIDNLPETELINVPKDVYAAYMRGDLDK